ncbi:MAG: hypothetical protein PVJ09_03820 [Candidatus Woesebacteria bacterium]|jgi:hypothetical protein
MAKKASKTSKRQTTTAVKKGSQSKATAKRKTVSKVSKKITKKRAATEKTVKKEKDQNIVATVRNVEIIKTTAKTVLSFINNIKQMSRRKFFGFAALLILAVGIYFFKGLLVVALINGQPISRFSVVSRSEQRYGKQIMDSLVLETLIFQESSKLNVSISQEEMDAELVKLEENFSSQGFSLDQFLELQGMSKDELIRNVKLQKLIEKLLADKVQITDEDIDQYLEDNKEYLPEVTEATEEAELRSTVTEQIKQQKLSEEFQTWLEELKANANIKYFVEYK